MSYTPVPAFLTGDTIDEPFLNTYWRDNMAAGLPDMFSAKGQLAVGLGVDDMGILNVGADWTTLFSDSTQTLGMIWKALISNRQGGSASIWKVAGTTNYVPASCKVQVGVVNLASISTVFNAIFVGTVAVTFPVAFSNIPIVFCSAISLVSANLIRVLATDVLANGFTVHGSAFASMSNQNVAWMAVGDP